MASAWRNVFRRTSPLFQCLLSALCVGLTAGIYIALSALGAGGGRPNSQHLADIAQSTLVASALFSGLGAGILLNKLGPTFCTVIGGIGYPVYVGGYWYFGENGKLAYPIAGAVILGATCTLIQSSMSYISIAYAEERHKGVYVGASLVVGYTLSCLASIIPLAIDATNPDADSVPVPVYGTFVALMGCAVIMGCFVLPPGKIKRDDGTAIATIPVMTLKEAVVGAAKCLLDWRLLLLIPSMIAAEIHLPFMGVTNAFEFNGRARALNSFIALLTSIPLNLFLGWLLDNKRWSRRARAYAGTLLVGVCIVATFVPYVVELSSWSRAKDAFNYDWTKKGYAGDVIHFLIAWNFGSMMLNLSTWYVGAMSNDPIVCANYSGLVRAMPCVGQAIIFGIDAAKIPYVGEAAATLVIYVVAVLGLLAFTYFCLEETRYFKEEHVIVPTYVLQNEGVEGIESVEVVSVTTPAQSEK
ncbi:Major facilitator superfamily domain, general substrate transporter [Niveomyces insectorum RCEF 264]|uniref:Major facilitator superfamily domain, general substrate transporter n=1 Tax=Niveomyces insectorum RCEF 264 TaxID=1081102 RepID=A0A167S2Z6_9HYPO|nr:Major facilitator superfamily domain, general substrate transporter [Niveomyces insectorum RCEF 264]